MVIKTPTQLARKMLLKIAPTRNPTDINIAKLARLIRESGLTVEEYEREVATPQFYKRVIDRVEKTP